MRTKLLFVCLLVLVVASSSCKKGKKIDRRIAYHELVSFGDSVVQVLNSGEEFFIGDLFYYEEFRKQDNHLLITFPKKANQRIVQSVRLPFSNVFRESIQTLRLEQHVFFDQLEMDSTKFKALVPIQVSSNQGVDLIVLHLKKDPNGKILIYDHHLLSSGFSFVETSVWVQKEGRSGLTDLLYCSQGLKSVRKYLKNLAMEDAKYVLDEMQETCSNFPIFQMTKSLLIKEGSKEKVESLKRISAMLPLNGLSRPYYQGVIFEATLDTINAQACFDSLYERLNIIEAYPHPWEVTES